MRSAVAALVPLAVLVAGCSAAGPAPASPTPAPPSPTVVTTATTTAPAPAASPTESSTPQPLPSIPDEPVPGEVVRVEFGDGGDRVGETSHDFSGRPVSYHVLCASHDGSVEVELWVDGEKDLSSVNECNEPFFTIEDPTFEAGEQQIRLEVNASGGASGLVYVVDGEI